MVHASLIAYLRTGQLGPFVSAAPRDTVLDKLGPPPYWDGWGGIAYEKSTIWVYDSIQFNFDERFQLEATHVGFDSTMRNSTVTYSEWNNSFIAFDDLSIDTIYTPEIFARTMKTNDIQFTQHSISGGRIIINTRAGVQARFCYKSDWKESIEHESPVRTAVPYLHRITTVLLA